MSTPGGVKLDEDVTFRIVNNFLKIFANSNLEWATVVG